jgi:hypothetical protein
MPGASPVGEESPARLRQVEDEREGFVDAAVLGRRQSARELVQALDVDGA